MFTAFRQLHDCATSWLAGTVPESFMLLFVRIALAGVFWRSGRSKLDEGSWFTISETTYELFRTEYAGVPLPPDLATVTAAGAEHLFPALLVLGLFTRLSAFALLVMTMVIQIFGHLEQSRFSAAFGRLIGSSGYRVEDLGIRRCLVAAVPGPCDGLLEGLPPLRQPAATAIRSRTTRRRML